MSPGTSRAKLAAVTREFSVRWQETRELWRDSKRDEFEERYMKNLLANVERAIGALDQLNEVVTKARKDCE